MYLNCFNHNVSTMFLLFFYLFVVLAQPSQREIQIQVNQQQIHIQASYQNGSSSDQFQFNAELDQGMNILNTLFQYQEQSETSQKQFQFSLQIMQVLEVDISSSPVYRGDSSTIVWAWPLESQNGVDWRDWKKESRVVNGILVSSYVSSSQDGIFVVRVTIAPKAVEINGGLVIDPNHVKLDFEFHEYPFRRHNTRLVLWARITSQIQIQDNQNNVNDDGGGFVFGNSSVLPFGTFTWVPTANVSGSDIPIVAWTKDKQYDQDNRHDIYFTFLTPEDNLHPPWITWDPKVGLGWNSAKSFWKQWYQRRVRECRLSNS
eukprot:TRINITY_DN7674_c0_g2_i12.p1 TRINITY_DN7674_c0_g2~~TRINITY_DN7674_c0_g2_i12.p1  ORF type:complete len:317 (-),score=68.38 TRINITY_DN7674_c0_g2_i12:866-1816(-)